MRCGWAPEVPAGSVASLGAMPRLRLVLVVLLVLGLGFLVAVASLHTRGRPPIPSREPPASAPPIPTGAAVLVGAGDIATCEGSADDRTAELLDSIPGTVFAAGDNAYPDGAERDYADCYGPTWGRHLERTRPAIGNHELDDDPAGQPYFAYFGERAGRAGEGWYAYDLGTWRIVVLNSNCATIGCGATSAQAGWLRTELADHPARCRAAIWHHPVFSSGEHGNDDRMRGLWELLQAAGTELVITGHDHDYERFAPMLADGTASGDGIRAFVAGTGGAPLRPIDQPRANSEAFQGDSHGVLRLALLDGRYEWAFIPVAGATFTDTGSGSCH